MDGLAEQRVETMPVGETIRCRLQVQGERGRLPEFRPRAPRDGAHQGIFLSAGSVEHPRDRFPT
eukprot:8389613-Pyramimonas_sp.AAC.1